MKKLVSLVLVIPLFMLAGCLTTLAPRPALTLKSSAAPQTIYSQSLVNLRDARAYLDASDRDERFNSVETRAIREIEVAIAEIKLARIDDGRSLNDHIRIDSRLSRSARLNRSLELLDIARENILGSDDVQFGEGLRDRIIRHIDDAYRIVERFVDKPIRRN